MVTPLEAVDSLTQSYVGDGVDLKTYFDAVSERCSSTIRDMLGIVWKVGKKVPK